jgi:hypothetical protein
VDVVEGQTPCFAPTTVRKDVCSPRVLIATWVEGQTQCFAPKTARKTGC